MNSRTILDSIRSNAIPAAMIGLGVFMLVRQHDDDELDFSSSDIDFAASDTGVISQAKDVTQGALQSTAERAAYLRELTRRRARMAQSQSRDLIATNPMMAGVAALAIGALIGGLIPETQKEHELLGETRDRLAQRAKDAARERVRDITSAATDAIKGSGSKEKTDVGHNVGIGSEF